MNLNTNQQKIIEKISKEYAADIFLFNAEIDRTNVDFLVLQIKMNINKKENCILFLTTSGGDVHAAYKLVRYIKNMYKKFHLYVFGYCKSAGTLIALGADEIIMSDLGEFGPLDAQIIKSDEIYAYTSGLNLLQSIEILETRTFEIFKNFFLGIKTYLPTITAKTVGKISTSLTIGFISPIIKQIDPLKIGEQERALNIALEYGKRICSDDTIVQKLVSEYVSHGFIIDILEAKNIFKNVRGLNKDELNLENEISDKLRIPRMSFQKPYICLLNDKVPRKENKKNEKHNKNNGRSEKDLK